MIQLERHAQGVVLPVRAHPGARREEVRGEHGGALKVSVAAAPEKGKANRALAALLATTFELRKADVELLSGETASHKRFLLRGVSLERVQQVLDRLGT